MHNYFSPGNFVNDEVGARCPKLWHTTLYESGSMGLRLANKVAANSDRLDKDI